MSCGQKASLGKELVPVPTDSSVAQEDPPFPFYRPPSKNNETTLYRNVKFPVSLSYHQSDDLLLISIENSSHADINLLIKIYEYSKDQTFHETNYSVFLSFPETKVISLDMSLFNTNSLYQVIALDQNKLAAQPIFFTFENTRRP